MILHDEIDIMTRASFVNNKHKFVELFSNLCMTTVRKRQIKYSFAYREISENLI